MPMPRFPAHLFVAAILVPVLAMMAVIPCARSAEPAMSDTSRKVVVIAHRGASALRPEHTLAAYAKAIEDGADAIEPDLVSTKDGFLVARHENEIGSTTDIAGQPQFAARKTRKSIDGEKVDGWFTEDFTLAELKTLRARERLPQLRSTQYDGQFEIATLEEIIAFISAESARRGRVIGLVPEIKHPTYFADLGLPMEDKLLATLAAHDYTRTAPVMIQSFETANLRALRRQLPRGGHVRLLQLLAAPDRSPYDTVLAGAAVTYAQLCTRDGLQGVAAYADAIGPAYRMLQIEPRDGGGYRSALVEAAHSAGLQVVAYTFRPENTFLEARFRSADGPAARSEAGAVQELRAYASTGVDGVFADDPALARRALDDDDDPQRTQDPGAEHEAP